MEYKDWSRCTVAELRYYRRHLLAMIVISDGAKCAKLTEMLNECKEYLNQKSGETKY